MKRLAMLLVIITAALLFLQSGVQGAEIEPIYLSPRPAARLVQRESAIAFRFAELVDSGTVGDAKLEVRGSISGGHEGELFVADDGRTVIFEPQESFAPGETVTVALNGGLFSTARAALRVEEYAFTVASEAEEVFHPAQFLAPQDRVGTRAPLADYL